MASNKYAPQLPKEKANLYTLTAKEKAHIDKWLKEHEPKRKKFVEDI